MKKKNGKLRKVFALLLALALLTTVLAACSSSGAGSGSGKADESSGGGTEASGDKEPSEVSTEPSGEEDTGTGSGEITYPLEGKPKLTVVAPQNDYVLASCPTWQETPFVQAWAEQTGVELEASFVSDFSVYLASGDYADIIINNWNSYSGGPSKAIEDGIIIGLEDYVEEFAPDYWKILNEEPNYKKGALTPQGNMVGFYNIRAEPARLSWGSYFRGDWLEDLNMEVPTTVDEFTELMKAFRDQKGATIPIGVTLGDLKDMGSNGVLTSAFDLVRTGYYQENGKVHYGAYEDAYKDYISYLHSLYEEGLIDSNILTVDGTITKSNLMNGVSGWTVGWGSGGLGSTMQQMAEVDPNFDLIPMGSLTKNEGERAKFGYYTGYLSDIAAAVSTSCKDVETAVKFLNYGYSEKGSLLMYYGIEGISFEMIDDYPYYTDFVKNNPDGLTFAQAVSLYDFSPANGPYVSNGDYSIQTYTDTQKYALQLWGENDVKDYYIPPVTISDEHMADYTSIQSEVDTCVDEYFAKFLTGEYSVDSQWDEYVSTLQSMGIDTMIEYYQEAFDEYQSR